MRDLEAKSLRRIAAAHPHALGDLSNVTATGEGSGGGFDADTVDGQHASEFADAASHPHALSDLSNVTATGEGSGGGFDADTVDGLHASAFAGSGHDHDAAYLAAGTVRTRGADIADKTSFSAVSTWEDWGSSLLVGDPGEEVFITAHLTGSLLVASGVNRSVRVRVGISTDGGSTYTFGNEPWGQIDNSGSNQRRAAISASHEVHNVTPSSGIRVKAQALISGGATTDMDFVTGHITGTVSPD